MHFVIIEKSVTLWEKINKHIDQAELPHSKLTEKHLRLLLLLLIQILTNCPYLQVDHEQLASLT